MLSDGVNGRTGMIRSAGRTSREREQSSYGFTAGPGEPLPPGASCRFIAVNLDHWSRGNVGGNAPA